MEGTLAIWVIASKETGKHIHDVFNEARFINPINLIETDRQLAAALQLSSPAPRLVLLDLGLTDGISRNALEALRSRNLESQVIVLVDDESEALLDQAYEAGVKTYLRKEFAFGDFLERARALYLQFVLTRSSE